LCTLEIPRRFSEKSEREDFHVYRRRKQSVIERHVIFFLKPGGKSVAEAAPPLYFSMKRDIEAIKDISIVKTGVVLFPNLATDNE
jgi:hypothetical protein